MTLTQINKAGLDEIALDHVFTIGASGSSAYTFQGEGLNGTVNNPTLYLTRGKTYRFENGSGGHPIRIQSTSGASGTAYNTGVTNNAGSGTVIVEVQHDAPDVLYYQCTSHAAMNGILYITGALADGGVTEAKIATGAVTTTKINASAVVTDSLATDAVTGAKIADNAIDSEHYTDGSIDTAHIGTGQVTGAKLAAGAVSEASKIADSIITGAKIGSGTIAAGNIASNAVTTAKIADGNVTAAKLASGIQTTINQNGSDRVITGSSTANNLNGQSNLTYNGTRLNVGTGDLAVTGGTGNDAQLRLIADVGDHGAEYWRLESNNSSNNFNLATYASGAWVDKVTVDSSGAVGIGTAGGTYSLELENKINSDVQLSIKNNVNGEDTGIRIVAQHGGSTRTSNIGHSVITNGTGLQVGSQDNIAFYTGYNSLSERVRIDDNGMKFNGDTAAANALDDYEEGTWTPSPHGYWSGGWRAITVGSGSISGATYTRVGRLVYFKCYFDGITFSGTGAGTSARIYGLPFTSANNGYGSGTMITHSNAFGNTNTGNFYIVTSDTSMLATKYGENDYNYATWTSTNGFYMMLSGMYEAA